MKTTDEKKHFFWDRVVPFLRELALNKKLIWIILGVIIFLLVSLTVFVIFQENRKKEIKKIYTEAFYKYQEIQNQTQNEERSGFVIAALEKVIKTGYKFSEYYLANYEIGSIYLNLKKYDLAKKYFAELKNADKDFFIRGKALINLAKINQQEEKYEEAINIYDTIISDYNNYLRDFAYYLKGVCYEKIEKIDLAISSYKMVKEDSTYSSEAKKSIDVIEKLKRLK